MNRQWLQIIVSVVMLTIAFVMFPTILDGTASITGHAHVNTFTGLFDVANIGPLVIFVGLIFSSVLTGALGIKGMTKKSS